MTDEEKKIGSSPIVEVNNTVNVMGENFDKAAADMLKATLQMPATETSGLLADIIGVVGDSVKVYRAERRVMILSDARERLAARGVSLDQSKPMLEGQVYDMIEGMGSAHTSELAEMWAGLMANAMDPNSEVSADTNYASIIGSLSVNDARVLTFLAAVEKQMAWEKAEHTELMKHYKHGMDGEKLENFNLIKEAIEKKVAPKASELLSLYHSMRIPEINEEKFALQSLWELKLIDAVGRRNQPETIRLPSSGRNHEMSTVVSQLSNQLKVMSDVFALKGHDIEKIATIQKNHHMERDQVVIHGRLSEFGRHFVTSCDIWESEIM